MNFHKLSADFVRLYASNWILSISTVFIYHRLNKMAKHIAKFNIKWWKFPDKKKFYWKNVKCFLYSILVAFDSNSWMMSRIGHSFCFFLVKLLNVFWTVARNECEKRIWFKWIRWKIIRWNHLSVEFERQFIGTLDDYTHDGTHLHSIQYNNNSWCSLNCCSVISFLLCVVGCLCVFFFACIVKCFSPRRGCVLNTTSFFMQLKTTNKRESCQSTWNTYWFFFHLIQFVLEISLCVYMNFYCCYSQFDFFSSSPLYSTLLFSRSVYFILFVVFVCCFGPLLFDGLALFWLFCSLLRFIANLDKWFLTEFNSMTGWCVCVSGNIDCDQIRFFVDSMNVVIRIDLCTEYMYYVPCGFVKVNTWKFSM